MSSIASFQNGSLQKRESSEAGSVSSVRPRFVPQVWNECVNSQILDPSMVDKVVFSPDYGTVEEKKGVQIKDLGVPVFPVSGFLNIQKVILDCVSEITSKHGEAVGFDTYKLSFSNFTKETSKYMSVKVGDLEATTVYDIGTCAFKLLGVTLLFMRYARQSIIDPKEEVSREIQFHCQNTAKKCVILFCFSRALDFLAGNFIDTVMNDLAGTVYAAGIWTINEEEVFQAIKDFQRYRKALGRRTRDEVDLNAISLHVVKSKDQLEREAQNKLDRLANGFNGVVNGVNVRSR